MTSAAALVTPGRAAADQASEERLMQVRPAWTDKATPRSKVHLTDSPVESTAPFVLTLCGQLGNGAGITMAFTTYLGYQDEACKKCVAAAAKRA